MSENNITISIAGIQMASGPNVSANMIEAGRLISLATDAGAKLIVLPENFAIMGMKEQDKVAIREKPGDGPIQNFLSEQASKNKVWLVGGTIPMEATDPKKIRAACLLYNDQGEQVARYDKAHLFDVQIYQSEEKYNESETIEAGDQVVVVDTPFGKLGLAVCYDLRFPEMFRNMVNHGAELIAIPAAFTAKTGRAHWEILVRARAIENLCYVVAAGQGGYHINGRESYGDSMIVDPWGQIRDRLSSGSGFVVASMDRKQITKLRQSFPVLDHRKMSCVVSP
ncbi:MAG: carbon-nitrogen hydrolase family protein [Gammaproteobacteria bacterium]|jgi:deaminated glutathione amidase